MTYHIVMHRSAIQTIGRTVTPTTAGALDGFLSQNVFDLAPTKLDTAELPALYSLLGSATYNEYEKGETAKEITRVYRVQCPVIPLGQADPQTRESLCQPLLERVQQALDGYPTLGNTAYVINSKVISDSGIVILPEWGAKFIGFEIRLQVKYLRLRTFGTGE